jgi:hypothetical protein
MESSTTRALSDHRRSQHRRSTKLQSKECERTILRASPYLLEDESSICNASGEIISLAAQQPHVLKDGSTCHPCLSAVHGPETSSRHPL